MRDKNSDRRAETAKLKRYTERVNQHKINRMFVQNQKRRYETE